MGDIFVMTLIKKKNIFLIFLSILFLHSCETFNELAGLTKQNVDDGYASEVPELVLPPDFGKTVLRSPTVRPQQSVPINPAPQYQNFQTVNPRITNYVAPKVSQVSPTPSHSLEKFKSNKKFTIGEWVYKQYVDGFKNGNIYYRPIYDKGYNFSRRYVPEQNIYSGQNYSMPDNGYFSQAPPPTQNPNQDLEFNSIDQLPVLK